MRLRLSPTVSDTAATARKGSQLKSPSLEVFLETSEHILKTVESIGKGQDDYAQLSRITTALAIAIKDDINNKNVAFGKDGAKLSDLCSIFHKVDVFLSRTAGTTWLKRLKDRKTIQATVAKFIERLEREAELLQISPEWLLLQESGSASKPDGVTLFLGSGKKFEQHKQTIHNMIEISVTKGMQDLSHKVRISKRTPATRGVDCVIWSGKMDNNSLVAVKHLLASTGSDQKDKRPIGGFLREAHIWFDARHHENVLPLLGIAQVGNSVAFISPWMEEGNLGKYIKSHSDPNIYQLLADVARGLAYLHSTGIVYNNLKMSSVLVSDIGRAYLFSFTAAVSQKQNHSPLGFLTNQSSKQLDSSELSNLHGSYYSTISGKREWRSLLGNDVFSFGSLIYDVMETRTSDSRASSLHSSITSHEHLYSRRSLDDNLGSIVQDCWQVSTADNSTMSEVACLMVDLSEEHLAISNPGLLKSSEPPKQLRDISKEIDKISQHPIAGGGYSDLYIGERKGMEKVALKLIRFFSSMGPDMEATQRRFRSEASLWSQFRHPRILEFYGVCNNGSGSLFMVTPFLENGTVLEYLSKVNPEADRVSLLSQAAEGLLYLHSRDPPVLHGDMKASNVLITKTGTAVLADFGLSKISHELTTTMLQGVGSPRWMAPELVMVGENKTGPVKTTKSDVYAYGHVILEVLSNKLPFFHLKEDVHVIVELIQKGRSPRPDGSIADAWLNDSAWAFSCECTAVDPEERPKVEVVVSQLHRLHGNVSFAFHTSGENKNPFRHNTLSPASQSLGGNKNPFSKPRLSQK